MSSEPQTALPASPEPLMDVLRRELEARGWVQFGTTGRRTARGFKHADGERAQSLTDAIVKQLVREARE